MAIANHGGDLAANNGGRHEDHRPPRNREASRDPYEDDYDDEDWDWDWDWGYPTPFPNPNRRRNPYANDHDFSDEDEDDFEPFPRRNRRRNTFANDYNFSDGDDDGFEPFPRRNRRRNTFANDYNFSDGDDDGFEPFPRRSRRRGTYANDYDRGVDYEDEFEPSSHRRRRNTRLSDYDNLESNWDYPELSRHRGPLRGTYTREIYRRGWDGEAPERPQYRGPLYGSRRDWDEVPEPIGPHFHPSHRHGRDRHRDASAPVGTLDPARRRQRARPQPRMMCRLLRSFLNFTMGGT